MMAKLPPRAPTTMAARDLMWPVFQPLDCAASWIHDDFVDFSATKRKAHRQNVTGGCGSDHGEFEDDDAQLIMCVFNKDDDRRQGSGSTSDSPGVKMESATCQTEEGATTTRVSPAATGSQQTVSDPKRVKRIIANRQSARRSRVRKLQYISELERSLTTLQTEVAMLSPRVAYMDHQRTMLSEDNSLLKTKIAALVQHNLFKDAHEVALKKEIERLKQVYKQQHQHQQNIVNKAAATTTPALSPT